MEEEIEHLKDIKEDFIYSVEHRTSLTNEEYLNAHRKILAIQHILNELERVKRENKKLREENKELKYINEQYRILNGELRKEINELKKQKQKILDYISEE